MGLTTALLVLLLVCQLPLAADRLVSSSVPGSASMLPEAEDPEFEFPDPLIPDFYFEPGLPAQQIRRTGIVIRSLLAAGDSHFSFAEIRAPPEVS